ncbi:hypothetical protein LCGC14_0597010 [marine sediment metagenome]|uniref:Uncharacterized protein n=1 Tax=marine sediment metagenome TaxID=412755 RepID=A0A0F9UK54_9ZZZZ
MVIDYKDDINRNNILQCLEGRIDGYIRCININFKNSNEKGTIVFLNQIQAIMDFIDNK